MLFLIYGINLMGNNHLENTTQREICFAGNLKIQNSTIGTIKGAGKIVVTDNANIQEIHSEGVLKIIQSKITTVKHTGRAELQDVTIDNIVVTGLLTIQKGTCTEIEYHGSRLELKNINAEKVTVYADRDEYTDIFIYKGSVIQTLILKGKNIRVIKDEHSTVKVRVPE